VRGGEVGGGWVACTGGGGGGGGWRGRGGGGVAAPALLPSVVDGVLARRQVGDAIRRPGAVRASGPTLACPQCDLVTRQSEGSRCPRCRCPMWRRKRNSLDRTVALSIAGAAPYLPANILPIMAAGPTRPPPPRTLL